MEVMTGNSLRVCVSVWSAAADRHETASKHGIIKRPRMGDQMTNRFEGLFSSTSQVASTRVFTYDRYRNPGLGYTHRCFLRLSFAAFAKLSRLCRP